MFKQHLKIKRSCGSTSFHAAPNGCLTGCPCKGTRLVDADTDTTGAHYAAGAESLPQLVIRLSDLCRACDVDILEALAAGDRESAIIHAARRSGMAEAAVALEGYMGQTPRLRPTGGVHQACRPRAGRPANRHPPRD